MDRLRRGIRVESIKEDKSRVQVSARADFNRLFRGVAVGDQNDVIRERANLDGAPTNLFDDARVSLSADRYDVAYLKRPVCLQRNSGEEVSERVLQCKSEDDAEDRRGREERAEVDFRKQET